MNEKAPVFFHNRNNHKLFGIYQKTGDSSPKNITILILSPGIKNRVAPHRLYVTMAKRFNELGFDVLRFDPEGIGDSEGEIVETEVAEVLSSVESGRFVESTIAAMNWLESTHGVQQFILSGLCGGAITGLLTAAQDERVDSLLGLGIPAVLSSMKRRDPYKYISRGELMGKRQHYLRQLLKPQKWRRFFTLKVDYRMIFKSLFMLQSSEKKSPVSPEKKNNNLETTGVVSNLNPLFYTSMFRLLHSSRNVCLIFSGKDRLYWEYEEKFRIPYQDEVEKLEDRCEVSVVPDANHIFSFPQWEGQMLEIATEWLKRKYP